MIFLNEKMTSKVLVEQKLQLDIVSQNFDLKSANTKQKQKTTTNFITGSLNQILDNANL